MCKSKQRQKNKPVQMDLFVRLEKPDDSERDGSPDRDDAGVELFSRLRRQQTLTNNLLDQVADPVNLIQAYRQVARNGGSPGVDGMTIKELKQWLNTNLNQLQTSLLKGTYKAAPVRKVDIPKPGGGQRMLGIPTVTDRLIQQAIHQKLSPIYEPYFSPYSFGFRPGRNAGQAISQASQYVREGNVWVVDIDLEKFFDKINHDRLMNRLSKAITDKRLLRLINAYLKTGMMQQGLCEQRTAGTPQGGPLSPLLSNIVLDELDRELHKRGLRFCRYADDCNVFVGTRKAAERVLRSLISFIETKLKLKVNRSKSGVRRSDEVTFLGYTVLSDGGIRVADKSTKRLKDKVREITKRNRGVPFSQLLDELNTVIRGWSNYFRLANRWLSNLRDIDGWIRRKLRCYRLKQCGRIYTTYKLLRSLGVGERKSWNVVMYSQGWWSMSRKMAVSQSMNPRWFARQGLHSVYLRMNPKT